jgi:hypothetical protein
MSVHQRRLKLINFTLDTASFECQVQSWNIDPGIEDGERQYTYCPDGQFVEETDGAPTLQLRFFADWRSDGISDFLWSNPNKEASFTLDHHPDIVGEHVRWTGKVLLKPPPTGGDVRTTESHELTLAIIGTLGNGLDYERVD